MRRGINLVFIALLAVTGICSCKPDEVKFSIFIGSYTGAGSEGIYHCQFNPETGKLSTPSLAIRTENPSFLEFDSERQLLFAVNELGDFKGTPSGAVSSFRIGTTSTLELINQVPSMGGAPCHVSMDQSKKYLLTANYSSGSVSVFPIEGEGALGSAVAFVQHEGSGANPERQKSPHAHSIQTTPENRFVLVTDLGIDKVMIYRFDVKTGSLIANDPPFAAMEPGAGPRHLEFSASGKQVYVLNELNSTISFFTMDPETGALEFRQTVSTLPVGFTSANTAAEITLDSHGDILYASNRGHNSIVAFEVNHFSGELAAPNWTPTGKSPRHFALDPTGRWLLVASQHGNSIDVLEIDHDDKKLKTTSSSIEINSPVCIRFVGAKN